MAGPGSPRRRSSNVRSLSRAQSRGAIIGDHRLSYGAATLPGGRSKGELALAGLLSETRRSVLACLIDEDQPTSGFLLACGSTTGLGLLSTVNSLNSLAAMSQLRSSLLPQDDGGLGYAELMKGLFAQQLQRQSDASDMCVTV